VTIIRFTSTSLRISYLLWFYILSFIFITSILLLLTICFAFIPIAIFSITIFSISFVFLTIISFPIVFVISSFASWSTSLLSLSSIFVFFLSWWFAGFFKFSLLWWSFLSSVFRPSLFAFITAFIATFSSLTFVLILNFLVFVLSLVFVLVLILSPSFFLFFLFQLIPFRSLFLASLSFARVVWRARRVIVWIGRVSTWVWLGSTFLTLTALFLYLFWHYVVFLVWGYLLFERFRVADDITEFMPVELLYLLDVFITFLEKKLKLRAQRLFIGFCEL